MKLSRWSQDGNGVWEWSENEVNQYIRMVVIVEDTDVWVVDELSWSQPYPFPLFPINETPIDCTS